MLKSEVIASPGSRAALLPPRPLRTVRESFPSHGSSLSNAPSRGDAVRRRLLVAPSRYAFTATTRSSRERAHQPVRA